MKRTKKQPQPILHIEGPSPPGCLFGIMPALCGRKQPVDYRMFPPHDEIWERAHRPFYAEQPHRATCKTCKKLYAAAKQAYEAEKRASRACMR